MQFLGEPKVNQFDIAVRVQQQIFWLEISVDNPPAVEVVEGLDDAAGVETSGRIVEVPPISAKRKIKSLVAARASQLINSTDDFILKYSTGVQNLVGIYFLTNQKIKLQHTIISNIVSKIFFCN